MAKDKKKKPAKDGKAGAVEAVEAVRSAVERTFQATALSAQSTRGRAQELVDEIAATANRVREALEELNLVEEMRGLRAEVQRLADRVAELERRTDAESASGTATSAHRKPAARRAAAKASARAAKPPARTKGTATAGRASRTAKTPETPTPADATPADDAAPGRS